MTEENGTCAADSTSVENGSPDVSELEKKIIKQIEYYFGDMNLGRDKFLQEQVKEDDGWVAMETMLKFKRLSALSTDSDFILKALSKSTSDLMEVNEADTKIRRCPDRPLPEFDQKRRDDLNSRSIYAKIFPEDITLDKLFDYFGQFGKVEQISMRRTFKKLFKGSVFVTFDSVDTAKKFMETESLQYEGKDLIRRYRDDYFKHKLEEKKQKKEEESKQREKDKQRRDDVEEQKFNDRITKGALLHLKNIISESSREEIKEVFEDYAHIAWVDFDRGETEATIRFDGENDATTAWDKVKEASDGKIMIHGAEVEARVLEGEEEQDHWREVFRIQREKRNSKRTRGGRGGRGGFRRGSFRGGRGRDRGSRGGRDVKADSGDEADTDEKFLPQKREAEDAREEPVAKQPKTECDGEKKDVKTEPVPVADTEQKFPKKKKVPTATLR